MDRHSAILNLCEAAEYVLYQIPLEATASREEHFATANLWSLEIESTCSQIIQFYRAVSSLIGQDLPGPAAALARAIHEACYRFKYLAEHEHELEDWEKWQIAQDYQLAASSIQHDLPPEHEIARNLERALVKWDDLLDGAPTRRPHPWRSTSEIFADLEAGLPNNRGKSLRRHVIAFFSDYVHIRRTTQVPSDLIMWSTDFHVLLTIRRGMVLCLEKGLLPIQAREPADEIVTECESLL